MLLIELLKEIYSAEYYDPEDRIVICTRYRLTECEKQRHPVTFKDAEAKINASCKELTVSDVIDYLHIEVTHQFNVLTVNGVVFNYLVLDRESL